MADEHLGLPAAPLGVAQVHPQQVAGEQRRLLAALARLDLDDHVLAVVRVARDEQLGEPASPVRSTRCVPARRPRRRRLGPRRPARGRRLRSPRAASSSRAAADDRGQLGVAPAQPAGRAWSACTAGSASALLELGVLGEQLRRAAPCIGAPAAARCSSGVRGRSVQTANGARRTSVGRRGRRSYLAAAGACRSAPRSGRPGRRCPGSSACRCRTGGSSSRPRRGSCRWSRCCGW